MYGKMTTNNSMATTIEKKEKISIRRNEFANLTKLESIILSDKVLSNFIAGRKKKSLKDLKGKIAFRNDYDYKLIRS